jgi:hypothetical protein
MTKHKVLLTDSVDVLNLPTPIRRCFQRASIKTVGDLVGKTYHDLFNIDGFGVACLTKVKRVLAWNGLCLRADPPPRKYLTHDEIVLQKWESRGCLDRVPDDKKAIVAALLENQEEWIRSPERKPEDFEPQGDFKRAIFPALVETKPMEPKNAEVTVSESAVKEVTDAVIEQVEAERPDAAEKKPLPGAIIGGVTLRTRPKPKPSDAYDQRVLDDFLKVARPDLGAAYAYLRRVRLMSPFETRKFVGKRLQEIKRERIAQEKAEHAGKREKFSQKKLDGYLTAKPPLKSSAVFYVRDTTGQSLFNAQCTVELRLDELKKKGKKT